MPRLSLNVMMNDVIYNNKHDVMKWCIRIAQEAVSAMLDIIFARIQFLNVDDYA